MVQKFGAPMVLKASYPDGMSRGEKWKLAKEAANYDQAAAKAKKNKDNTESIRLKQSANQLHKKASTMKSKDDK
jgi:hypothetical protein